jgi:hypothetical protein
MKTHSAILQGSDATEENAWNFAQSFDFSEQEEEEYQGRDHQYIGTVNGIDIYYHFGADYYFFTNSDQ